MSPEQRELESLRESIGALDLVLLDVLKRRAWYVREVGRVKARAGLPVRDLDQEERVFDRVVRGLDGDRTYSEEVVREVFAALMRGSEDINGGPGR